MAPSGTIIHHLERSMTQHADRAAIEEWPAGRTLTYAELDAASAAMAAELAARGVGPGSFVPLVMPRGADYLVAVVAILRCGAAYAPIDPAAPRREAMLAPLHAAATIGAEPGMLDPSATTGPGRAPEASVEPHAPAYVMYTSGTTGTPKGVLVPHRAVVRLVIDADYASFGPDRRWGVMSAVAFDASTLEIWGALLHGGCCVVQTMPLPSLEDLAEYLTKGRVSDTWLTASLFNAMVDEHPGAMAGMRQLLSGGERESLPHVRRFKARCPGVTLIHGYGPTENTTFSLCHTITDDDAAGERIPIGAPIRGSTMRLIEPAAPPDAPREPLSEGELLVGGEGLALGYLGDQARTAEKFVADADGERWYRTGDLVRLRPDGAAIFVGRVDRQVKIRGHRVEPDGVESELAACAGVDQAAVAVTGDTAETRRMVAFFVPRGGATAALVRAQLAERLPPTMMPERFEAIGSMPLGPTGKADRAALLARLERPATPTLARDTTHTEARLIELFSARLGRTIAPDERFQDVGGHSLLAMRLSADVRRELGVALPAAEILRRQTISQIAELLDTLPAATPPPADGATDPIGDIRRRASLEHARDATGAAMLVHHAWQLTPAIDTDRLREAWLALLERHDALRTSVAFTDAGPTLVEHDPRRAPVFHDEHDRLAAPNPGDPSVRAAAERTIGPSDPPARLHVWRVADGSQLVLLVFHHAAIDEWSLDLIAGELDRLLRGQPLDEPTPYTAFVRAEAAMRSEPLAADLARRLIDGAPPTTAMPPAGPQEGLTHALDDDALSASALDARAAELGVAPAALAAAALSGVLQERYGPPARWLMTPVARRPSEALQRVVGCCLDMRLLEAGPGDLENSAQALHQQLLDAQDDRTLPLELLIDTVRATAPERADDATRFGLTYRHIDDGARPMGPCVASPTDLEVPAARFGLCLHVERRASGLRLWLEASRAHYTGDELGRIADRLTDVLLGRAELSTLADPPAPAPTAEDTAKRASAHELHELSQFWRELLGVDPRPGGDFFQDGGTSLLAMRLAAAVHKRLGRRLMLNQFLRLPTMEGLARSIRDDAEHPFAEFSAGVQGEAASDAPWAVAIPGSAGRAIDLYRLWTEIGRDARAVDMMAFDLATIAVGETAAFDSSRFFSRFTALTHAYAMTNDRRGPLTLVGYSLGGLVAMDMARKLGELGHTIDRVVLLDAYAPPFLSRTPAWYLGKLNARVRTLGRSDRGCRPARVEHASGDAHAAEASRAAWRSIHRDLAAWTPPTLDAPVTIVRSGPAWKHVRPLRFSRTNGLGPALRGPVDVRVLDVEHLAMLTTGADRVAAELRPLLTLGANAATRAPRESLPPPIERHRA